MLDHYSDTTGTPIHTQPRVTVISNLDILLQFYSQIDTCPRPVSPTNRFCCAHPVGRSVGRSTAPSLIWPHSVSLTHTHTQPVYVVFLSLSRPTSFSSGLRLPPPLSAFFPCMPSPTDLPKGERPHVLPFADITLSTHYIPSNVETSSGRVDLLSQLPRTSLTSIPVRQHTYLTLVN